METAKIVFLDGTELETDHNGDCFIVDTKPQFPDDLSEVTIIITSGSEETTSTSILHNAAIKECYSNDGRYWFSFIITSEAAMKIMEIEAQTYYTAMMTDTLLEE